MAVGKTQKQAVMFLKVLVAFYPLRIHNVLTDNDKDFALEFTREYQRLGIKHHKTKVKHPWTNGQVEITIKRIKQETIWKIYYPDYRVKPL